MASHHAWPATAHIPGAIPAPWSADEPQALQKNVTLARSSDGGETFVNYAWSDMPFETQQPAFLGDYTWLTAYNGRVYGVGTEALPAPDTPTTNGRPPRPATAVRLGVADFSPAR